MCTLKLYPSIVKSTLMTINLTLIQKSELEKQHKSEREGRIRDRIKVVLLCSEGWTHRQIAQALCINESTVSEHLNGYLYFEGKLKPENGGTISKLNHGQTSELIAHIEGNTYILDQIEDPGFMITVGAFCDLIFNLASNKEASTRK